jgi:hypothetical protein
MLPLLPSEKLHRRFLLSNVLIITVLALILPAGCELFDRPEPIPAYITIESIELEHNPDINAGSLSNRIVDAWVFINDQLIGAFELPCTIPVLHEGVHEVTVLAGIYLNGVRGTRVYYPFYAPFTDSVRLTPDSITRIQPKVRYDSRMKMPLHESFELGGVLFEEGQQSLANLIKTNTAGEVFEGNYSGKILLDRSDSIYLGVSVQNYKLPTAGGHVFLEVDFLTEVPLVFGVYANKPGQVVMLEVAGILPQENWTKVYINLTPTVFRNNDADNFRIFMGAHTPADKQQATILIDNIKLIHF